MRKNMSLCRRVVGTSLLAITLLGMSSVGVNKVAANSSKFESEMNSFVANFKSKSKNDNEYKKAVAALSDEALNYLMFRVVADYNIDPNYFSEGSPHTTASDLNYLGTSKDNKNKEARKIVFEEMRKRIKERDQFKSNNQLLTDEVKYQRGENNKLNEKNLTLSEAMVTHYQNLQKAEEEKAKLSQDLDKKTTDLKNLTEQFRLTLLKDESDKKKLETERDALKTKSDDL
ncbi:hypothetical protein, partial [Streptococcus canis]